MRPHPVLALLAPVALLVLAACGGGDGPEARTLGPAAPATVELTRSGGCGEAYLWAASEDGTVVVAIWVEIPRWSTIDPVEIEIDVTDPDVDADVLRGHADMTRNLCVDVIEEEAQPDETIPLVEGTGEVVIGPIPTDVDPCGHATGTLELDDAVAEDGTRFGHVTAETTDIGCFAG